MTQMLPVSRDLQDWAGGKPPSLQYLRHAQRRSGRKPIELASEYVKLHFGRGKLTLPEYVQFGVYDLERIGADEQMRFISNELHWPITRACCDMTCQGLTEDKWLCSTILERAGIRVPETLAIIDRSSRTYPGLHKLGTPDALRGFLKGGELPLFAKVNRGICSFGALLLLAADDEHVHLADEGAIDYAAFMDRFVGTTPYLLQRVERNHPFFDPYVASLATVRVCILLTEDEVRIPFTILKLPSRRNVADNFWRPGNLACDVNSENGTIITVRSRTALGTTDHSDHPETGVRLLGETLPMWDRVLDMARRSAPIFHSARYQSMDIAITENGPVLVEVNTGGGFDLPQLASGRGFLTDDVGEFFRICGYPKL